MTPPLYRYVLSHASAISQGIGAIGALVLMLAGLHCEGSLTLSVGAVTWVALAAVLAAAIGWMLGVFALCGFVLGPIAARLQGWPFPVGDRVWILSGAYKNSVATVYKVWAERGQVRVDLGPELEQSCEDVYCAVAVCRAHKLLETR